jgi:hypothetical protein
MVSVAARVELARPQQEAACRTRLGEKGSAPHLRRVHQVPPGDLGCTCAAAHHRTSPPLKESATLGAGRFGSLNPRSSALACDGTVSPDGDLVRLYREGGGALRAYDLDGGPSGRAGHTRLGAVDLLCSARSVVLGAVWTCLRRELAMSQIATRLRAVALRRTGATSRPRREGVSALSALARARHERALRLDAIGWHPRAPRRHLAPKPPAIQGRRCDRWPGQSQSPRDSWTLLLAHVLRRSR